MDPAEEADDLVGGQVVDKIEAQHGVIPAAQVVCRRVPVPVLNAVGHPGPGDDLAANRRAARQVEYGRGQPRIAAALSRASSS